MPKSLNAMSFLTGGLGEVVNHALEPGETVLDELEGTAGQGVVLTDRRLIFARASTLGGRRVQYHPVGTVRDAQVVFGVVMGELRATVVGIYDDRGRRRQGTQNTCELTRITLVKARQIADRINLWVLEHDTRGHAEPSSPAAPTTSAPGLAAELERLASLRASGALTDEEFQAAKRRLLG